MSQTSYNGHISRWTWVSWFPLRSSSSSCSEREPLGISERFF